MKRFPQYRSHYNACNAGCFHCGARLEGRALDEGYARGHGQYSQRCVGRCGMKTFYDIARNNMPAPRIAA